ncbi:hypothetical protein ACIF81_07335 [Pseudomonas juntendi]|uniref:hypothetical protein n=1 Tax=Pseudomonas juntendi TaxID=2666183 RepID=UPI0018D9941E|nr:hypothetical protein [Pseudomonas juntendi]MBH3372432.1 hypothetical protein [Pseudomonas juntendi]
MRKSNPPTRRTYLAMIICTPFILLLALWMQSDLTPHTAAIALGVTGLLYLNIRWIQDFFRDSWRQEYEQKLAHTEAQLARKDLTAKQRRRLQHFYDQLPDRFHLVTSPDQTYRTVKVVGVGLKAAAHALREFFR